MQDQDLRVGLGPTADTDRNAGAPVTEAPEPVGLRESGDTAVRTDATSASSDTPANNSVCAPLCSMRRSTSRRDCPAR